MAWKILGQLRPANTTAASLFSPTLGKEYRIDVIYVCETAGNTPTYRIFFDDNGSTYDQTTAIAYNLALTANQSKRVEGPFYMNDGAGNIGVRTSAANEITFTAFGEEVFV
jgi:hypothetical protein